MAVRGRGSRKDDPWKASWSMPPRQPTASNCGGSRGAEGEHTGC